MNSTNQEFVRKAPSVTVFLFAYNQAEYIKQACESILAQDYSPLEIIFSDDCSSDDTFKIMTEVAEQYSGPHKVKLNKNEHNIGLIPHINLANKLAAGELLVAAAGDDISEPNRVTEIVTAYCKSTNQPTSIYSDVLEMSPSGELGKVSLPPVEKHGRAVEKCAVSSALICGASHAWHKSLFEKFGEITELKAYEDLVLAYRSSILKGLVYVNKPLVKYRLGVGISESGKYDNKAKADSELRKKMQIREVNIMLPVLSQRLIDSKTAQVDPIIIKLIEDRMNKYELVKQMLLDQKSFLDLFSQAKKTSILPFFFKSLLRKLRGKNF